eukprot:2760346-Rhodomonas_salina.1
MTERNFALEGSYARLPQRCTHAGQDQCRLKPRAVLLSSDVSRATRCAELPRQRWGLNGHVSCPASSTARKRIPGTNGTGFVLSWI